MSADVRCLSRPLTEMLVYRAFPSTLCSWSSAHGRLKLRDFECPVSARRGIVRHKLTDRYIQTVRPPGSGRLVVADTEVTGLTLRVTPSGTRSFMVRYRPRLRPQRSYTVPGAYPMVTLAAARQRARDILAAAKRGVDLIADEKRLEAERRKTQAAARTLGELAAEYVERACRPHQRRWRFVEQRLRNHVVPVLGDRMVRDIRRADIVELLDAMAHEKGLRQQVNRTRGTLATMF
ncbi:MAG TPA: integrase arm-type DNA-binding domain-containing protein [Verrucomicrobiae bacterium]|nr:integrase arm-type DNA-binding domain-containing protein [Verrucomicrobiae bacterium]